MLKAFQTLVYFLFFAFGLCVGGEVITIKWRTDCEKLGAHVSQGDVYTCAKKP